MEYEINFIHAADLHLDSPFKGLTNLPQHIFQEIKDSTFLTLNRLVETAIEKQVDFILISGDLFDNEKQSLKAQIRLKKAFERLLEHDIVVYLSYGNHDYLKGNLHQVAYPENVFIFPDDKVRTFTFEKDGVPLASISGFSYMNRQVEVNKASEYKADTDAHFHIAMLHGSVQGDTEHATYAPFQISELAAKDFDYWALGHIHKRRVLKEEPLIVYSGNTQGRHRNETGEKGCYHVYMAEAETKLTFIPLHQIEFQSIHIDVSNCNEVYELETTIQQALKRNPATESRLLDITLQANHSDLNQWETTGQLGEMIEIINEGMSNESPWQYIFRVDIEVDIRLEDYQAYYGEHFLGELNRRFDDEHITVYLRDLYQHKQARKYLELPSTKEEQEIKEAARTRLMNELLKGG